MAGLYFSVWAVSVVCLAADPIIPSYRLCPLALMVNGMNYAWM